MSSLSSYIAQKYLSASTLSSHPSNTSTHNDVDDRPPKRRKKDKKEKKKRREENESNMLIIADDDDDDDNARRGHVDADPDADGPQLDTYASNRSAEFRRKKNSGWMDVSGSGADADADSDGGKANGRGGEEAEAEEADRILREAVEQDRERRRDVEMEDAPAIVDVDLDIPIDRSDEERSDRPPKKQMRAGLQTAADLVRDRELENTSTSTSSKKKKHKEKEKEEEEETIYRDASGRRIDINAKRIEARQREREAEEAKRREREAAMGDVQRQQRQQHKQDLENAKFLTLARTEDDEEMNEQLKSQVRWGDVMAGYIAEKAANSSRAHEDDDSEQHAVATTNTTTTTTTGAKQSRGNKGRKQKEYSGHAAPNRYGIKPGWRWDGVDRGNGFEKQWFQARAQQTRNSDLSYQWQEDL